MDEATAKALREPFPPELIGRLPRVWCGACRDARSRVCSEHSKARCGDCGNNITSAHLHLDYVGHADVTDRLLAVDPSWTWEPLALDPRGLPAVDDNGGLWIRVTVAGVTRLGYGHADGKRGGDAVKETIGDAIRNAALRFGVALDLWRKEPPPAEDTSTNKPARPRRRPASETGTDDQPISREMVTAIQAGMTELGYGGQENRDKRMDVTRYLSGEEVQSTNQLTRGGGKKVLDGIAERKRALAQNGGPAE